MAGIIFLISSFIVIKSNHDMVQVIVLRDTHSHFVYATCS